MHRCSSILVLLLLTLPFTLRPPEAQAQVSFGAYGVRVSESADASDGAEGVGLRAGLSFPLLPLSAYAAGEKIFLDCPVDGCSEWAGEIGLELNVLPLPIVHPYVTAGMVRRRLDAGGETEAFNETGVSAGLGISAGVPGIRGFLEGRYEFLDDPFDGFVFRLGVMF